MKLRLRVRRFYLLAAALGILSIVGSIVLGVSQAYADCGTIKTSVIDCSGTGDTTGSPIVSVLVVGIQILTALVGVAAIAAFVYAGIMYSSASGNASQTAKSKEIIRNTLIGLVLFAAMVLVLNWLIPGGLFDGTTKFGAGGNGQSSSVSDGSDDTSADADNNPDSTLQLEIASWNMYKFNSTNKAVSGGSTVAKEVDILGVQEARSFSLKIAANLGSSYSMYPNTKSGPIKIAVIWNNKKLSAISKGTFKGGYQPDSDLQREFVWIKFKEKTSGKVFYFINTHFPNSAVKREGGNEYYTGSSDGKAWVTHMKKLVAKLEQLQKDDLPIFITGDFNFDYRGDTCKQTWSPCKALGKGLDVKSGWEYTKLGSMSGSVGTAGGTRIIDYVWSWDRDYITYQSMHILHGGNGTGGWSGSDHKPVGMTLTIGPQT